MRRSENKLQNAESVSVRASVKIPCVWRAHSSQITCVMHGHVSGITNVSQHVDYQWNVMSSNVLDQREFHILIQKISTVPKGSMPLYWSLKLSERFWEGNKHERIISTFCFLRKTSLERKRKNQDCSERKRCLTQGFCWSQGNPQTGVHFQCRPESGQRACVFLDWPRKSMRPWVTRFSSAVAVPEGVSQPKIICQQQASERGYGQPVTVSTAAPHIWLIKMIMKNNYVIAMNDIIGVSDICLLSAESV